MCNQEKCETLRSEGHSVTVDESVSQSVTQLSVTHSVTHLTYECLLRSMKKLACNPKQSAAKKATPSL